MDNEPEFIINQDIAFLL